MSDIVTASKNNFEIIPISQPDRLLEMAISNGADMAQIEKFLDLKERYDKEQARKAYHASFSDFKKNPPIIVKDMVNLQFGSKYTSIGNMVMTASAALAEFGLSTRWSFDDNSGVIACTCSMSHAMGHTESVTLTGMPDTAGKKNPIQERKSTRTYLKLETFEAVTGLVSVFSNLDDDGNSAGNHVELITEEQATKLHARITDNDLNMDIFLKWAKVDKIESIKASNFEKMNNGIDASIKAKNK